MRLAAIDLGSNAARLLITEVLPTPSGAPQFQKLNLVRVPLRLGFDVFEGKHRISAEKEKMILHTLLAYQNLLKAYGISLSHVKAAATSAMRDAKNSSAILEKIRRATGINVEIISGDTEASLIYENHIAESMDRDHEYLYIDVGGGSTELTFFAEGKLQCKRSFNIGTIRLLKNQVSKSLWEEMKDFLKKETRNYAHSIAIGSGGNINKIFSMSKRKEGKPLTLPTLKDYYKVISAYNIPDRIRIFQLREDRADVIVPALQIYIQVMRWAGIEEIYVPKIGLADGLIQHLYQELIDQDVLEVR